MPDFEAYEDARMKPFGGFLGAESPRDAIFIEDFLLKPGTDLSWGSFLGHAARSDYFLTKARKAGSE
jgi:hypothetical protein